jgi:hypothetical protein
MHTEIVTKIAVRHTRTQGGERKNAPFLASIKILNVV